MTTAATIFVKYLESMASFYEAGFEMKQVAGEPGDFRVLESDAWTLMLVQVPDEIAAEIDLSDPPVRRAETPIKLSFDVPSIAVTRVTITDLGGRVDDDAWEFHGYRHCDFTDPEGNVNQLREAVTTQP